MHRRFPATLIVAFVVAGLFLAWRQGGDSPVVWYDTLVDQGLVVSCAQRDACVFEGVGASVAGPKVGAGWHLIRYLMHSVGVSPTGVHRGLNVLEGLVVPVTAVAGWYAGGTGAGALAGLAAAAVLGSGDVHHPVVYNSRPASFIGAVFLLLAVVAVERRRIVLLMMAAAVAGVATDFHPVNGFLGVSAVALSLLFPGRRLHALALATVSFAVVTFLGSPWMWTQNILLLIGGWTPVQSTFYVMAGATYTGTALLAAIAIAAGLVQVPRFLSGERDRAIWVAVIVVILPLFLVFVWAAQTGTVENSRKYLIVLASPIAMVLGWSAWRLIQAVYALACRFLGTGGLPAKAGRIAGWVFCGTCVLAVAALPVEDPLEEPPVIMDRLTVRDIELVSRYLAGPGGWGADRAYRSIIGPRDRDALVAMRLLAPLPEEGVLDHEPPSTRVLLKARDSRLPKTLPATWTVLDRDRGRSLLLIPLDGWIDRSRFEACYAPAAAGTGGAKCLDVKFAPEVRHEGGAPAGMNPVAAGNPTTVSMRFPIKVSGAPGVHEILMPRLPLQCSGRIVAVEGLQAEISEDGLRARMESISGNESGEVLLAWDAAGPDCIGWAFSGFPPFFIEGVPSDTRALESLLHAGP